MKYRSLAILGLAVSCATTSCVNDDYDLSNIDTTVRVEVKDLALPLNLEDIELSTILDLGEDDQIKVVNGKYCFVEEGNFHSDPVKIDGFTLAASSYQSINLQFPFAIIPGIEYDGGLDLSNTALPDFSFETGGIPKEIKGMDYIGGKETLHIEFIPKGIEAVAKGFVLSNLCMQVPKGLDLEESEDFSYDKNTGDLKFTDKVIEGSSYIVDVNAKGIDMDLLGLVFDPINHYAKASGEFILKSGHIAIREEDVLHENIVTTIDLQIGYRLSDVEITSFTGEIEYEFDGVDISDISLSDIPDVLEQGGTNLLLANPQIYVTVNNPVQKYGVTARTGIEITSYAEGQEPNVATLDDGYFTIGTGNPSGIYAYCLSPSLPDAFYEGFTHAEHVKFTDLSYILAGEKIPTTIGVELTNPGIPQQQIKGFELGKSLDAIDGAYAFVAPIALLDGSYITYTDTEDGWYSEDIEDMTITNLALQANVTSDLPIGLDLKVEPLDVNGNLIENIVVEPIKINPKANNELFQINISGQINKLDGVRFTATAVSGSSDAISPDMKLKLDNLCVRVSGYYDDEL